MKFKKIITVLCAAMLITSAVASCGNNNSDDFSSGSDVSVVDGVQSGDSQTSDDPSGNGNSQGSVVDVYNPSAEYELLPTIIADYKICPASVTTSYFTVDDQYIYYIDNQDEGIYKIPKDGSGDSVKLSDAKVSTVDINSDGKLVYTTNMEDGMDSNSFTMNKDGSNVVDNKELVLDFTGPTEFTGPDGKIYATLGMNEGFDEDGIYVRDADADVSEAKLIKAGFIDSFCITDNYIVCCIAGAETSSVYRCALDGSSMVKILDASASKLSVSGDKIYFINRSDNDFIYEVTIDAIKNAK